MRVSTICWLRTKIRPPLQCAHLHTVPDQTTSPFSFRAGHRARSCPQEDQGFLVSSTRCTDQEVEAGESSLTDSGWDAVFEYEGETYAEMEKTAKVCASFSLDSVPHLPTGKDLCRSSFVLACTLFPVNRSPLMFLTQIY